jgi:hypothetical protein
MNKITYTAKEMLYITKECKKRSYGRGYRAKQTRLNKKIESLEILINEFKVITGQIGLDYSNKNIRHLGQTGLKKGG